MERIVAAAIQIEGVTLSLPQPARQPWDTCVLTD